MTLRRVRGVSGSFQSFKFDVYYSYRSCKTLAGCTLGQLCRLPHTRVRIELVGFLQNVVDVRTRCSSPVAGAQLSSKRVRNDNLVLQACRDPPDLQSFQAVQCRRRTIDKEKDTQVAGAKVSREKLKKSVEKSAGGSCTVTDGAAASWSLPAGQDPCELDSSGR